MVKLEGKGKGLVATRKVATGDILLQETPLMVIDSEDKEVRAVFSSPGFALPEHFQVSSDVFKVEFEAVDEVTKSKVLELFDPVRDDLKLELFENISEVEAGIRKSQEESPDNQELGELARRMGELGAGIVRWVFRGKYIFRGMFTEHCSGRQRRRKRSTLEHRGSLQQTACRWKSRTDSDQCDCAGLRGGSPLFCYRGGTLPSHIPH